MSDSQSKVQETYDQVQLINKPEEVVSSDQIQPLTENWKNETLPSLQRKVVDVQLENLRTGIVDPVFSSFIEALKQIPLSEFCILDAACASGYYFEVIRKLDPRKIQYRGSDYSASMVELARSLYPDASFEVQDLTALGFNDKSFDVVMAAGVLEHVPDYKKAIAEICRVSRQYIILHRCPLTSFPAHQYTVGSQYNIETARIFYSWKVLEKDFQQYGFRVLFAQDVYPEPPRPFRWRSLFRILRKAPDEVRTTRVFLLQRI